MPTEFFARFFKCDLQMQTPMEPHWRDLATKLNRDDSDDRKKEVAREYLRACHAVGLEVIGITDHNLAPDPDSSFISLLQSLNREVAGDQGRTPLIIFPGFEIEANVGRGCHVLCLFPPATPLAVLHDRLTTLGLPGERRFNGGQPLPTNKTLAEILDVIQDNGPYSGVVIAAHPTEKRGLFDNDGIADWLQQEEFVNPNLLCIEIPKPIGEMSAGWRRLLKNGPDCQPDWRRVRPIACVMSSDCYRINEDPNAPGNFIGFRYSWIKMTHPSIEALRQAFLDSESRIRLQGYSPEAAYNHPRILNVMIQGGTFVRRLEPIRWGPNLNCIIGSRGTGKSTILDYLRAALDRLRDEDLPESLAGEIRRRVKDTLPLNARVTVEIGTPGGTYRIVYSANPEFSEIFPPGGDAPAELDIRTLFPCRILSQREIDHSVGRGDSEALRKILDDFLPRELQVLEQRAQVQIGAIRQIEASLAAKRVNQQRRPALETERQELNARLQKQEAIRALLPAWRNVEAEANYLRLLSERSAQVAETFATVIKDIEAVRESLHPNIPDGEHRELLDRMLALVDGAMGTLVTHGHDALEQFKGSTVGVDSELDRVKAEEWDPIYTAEAERFRAAGMGEGEGNIIGDYTRISARVVQIERELRTLGIEAEAIRDLERDRNEELATLNGIWVQQTELRESKAVHLMDRLRPSPGAKPLVEVLITPQGDEEALVRILERQISDRRRLNTDDIRTVLDALKAAPPLDEPAPLLSRFIWSVRGKERIVRDSLPNRREHAFFETFNEDVLRSLELERVPDRVVYLVFRNDGTLAGPIERVSAGQQGTAILNLLLAEGDEPLLIDTPEEGLDSEGVFTDLVPLFRREKERRQILVVTHNANIPVCADAEGILALEAAGYVTDDEATRAFHQAGVGSDGELLEGLDQRMRWRDWERRVRAWAQPLGMEDVTTDTLLIELGIARHAEARIKLMQVGNGQVPACGALDVQAAKLAVQDIMEGSQEAFTRRLEKYGF